MPSATEPSSPPSSSSHTFLPAHVASWRCATCTLELALQDELVSRSFQGASGPAFLWRTVINADVGPKAKKQLMSGTHLIAPLFCRGCATEVGWKYFGAPDSSQKYKEDKCILEKARQDLQGALARSPPPLGLESFLTLFSSLSAQDNKWSVNDDDLDGGG
ncbi:hypothetical protein JCM3775_003281 [Rhodotorula graminis]